MDGLLDRLRQEVDPARRVPIAQEFEKYVVDEYCPWLFLYDEEHIYGVNKNAPVDTQPVRADGPAVRPWPVAFATETDGLAEGTV